MANPLHVTNLKYSDCIGEYSAHPWHLHQSSVVIEGLVRLIILFWVKIGHEFDEIVAKKSHCLQAHM